MKHVSRLKYAWWLLCDARFYEAYWALWPDNCEMPGCNRNGILGNENRLEHHVDGEPIARVVCCDYCIVKQDQEPLEE